MLSSSSPTCLGSSCKARAHCATFAQALITALAVTWLAWSLWRQSSWLAMHHHHHQPTTRRELYYPWRIHGAGFSMLTWLGYIAVYWWDPCYQKKSSTMDPSWAIKNGLLTICFDHIRAYCSILWAVKPKSVSSFKTIQLVVWTTQIVYHKCLVVNMSSHSLVLETYSIIWLSI